MTFIYNSNLVTTKGPRLLEIPAPLARQHRMIETMLKRDQRESNPDHRYNTTISFPNNLVCQQCDDQRNQSSGFIKQNTSQTTTLQFICCRFSYAVSTLRGVSSPIPLLVCPVGISSRVGQTDTIFTPTHKGLVFFFFFYMYK